MSTKYWILDHLFQGCQMAKFDPFLSLDCARVDHGGRGGAIQGIKICHLATLNREGKRKDGALGDLTNDGGSNSVNNDTASTASLLDDTYMVGWVFVYFQLFIYF